MACKQFSSFFEGHSVVINKSKIKVKLACKNEEGASVGKTKNFCNLSLESDY